MCINRWGNPEYVKSLGTMNLDGSNQRTHTIIFTWPKLIVDGRTVEISFQMDSSEFTIEELNRGQNPWPHVAKHAIVKEFRMSGLPK